MAQEVYYSAPELRHMVGVPDEAGEIEKYTPPPSDDPAQDPDYSMWGDGIATVDYMQMVPYLVKGVQEIVTELPRSKTTVSNVRGQNIAGLVVSANANAHKTNATPIVALSNVYADKKWYGVVSNTTTDTNDYDTLVDTKGDTQIWVTDVGGPLESGDLVTTSNVAPGYAQKQGDDLLRSSTVAKVTQDCDFTEPAWRPIRVPKRELSNVTYYRHDALYEIDLEKHENVPTFKTRVDETPIYFKEVAENSGIHNETRYYEGDVEVSERKYNTLPEDSRSIKHLSEISVDDYEALDDEAKATYSIGIKKRYFMLNYSMSKTQIPQHDEEVVVEELIDVLDENGQIVWEDTGETEPVYTLVDHGSYKAALVSAKLV
jgi:plasmid maintenance system killer protein